MGRGIDIFFRVWGIIVVSVDKAASSHMDAENAINLGKKKMKERWKGRAISTVCVTHHYHTATVRYVMPPLFLLFLLSHVMQRCPVDVPIWAVPPMIKINIRRFDQQLIPVRPGRP
jgi:hypothetical protein